MYHTVVVVVVLLAHQKSSPPRLQFLSDSIVTPLASFTVGFLAENTEQDLNFGAGLQLLIIIILIPQVQTECITLARAFES